MPAALPDESVDLAETKAGAGARGLGGEEGIERLVDHLLRHSGAGIGHGYHDILTGFYAVDRLAIKLIEKCIAGLDGDLAAFRHRVAGVNGEIEYRGLQLRSRPLR